MAGSAIPRGIALVGVTVVVAAAACSGGPTSEEYEQLRQQLTSAEADLVEVTAERDELLATSNQPSARHDRSLATQDAIDDILSNPEAHGTEDDVVQLLASHATPTATMVDAVFGAARMTAAWRNTLYADAMDAEIDTHHRWLSEDGSQGGALFVWHGTNPQGHAFRLPGVVITDYDEQGLVAHQYVTYPFTEAYVEEAIRGNGTAGAEATTRLSSIGSGAPLAEGLTYATEEGASPRIGLVAPNRGWQGAASTCYDRVESVVLATPAGGGVFVMTATSTGVEAPAVAIEASRIVQDVRDGGAFSDVDEDVATVSGFEAVRLEATIVDRDYLSTFDHGRGYWQPDVSTGDRVILWVVDLGVPDVVILATDEPPGGFPADGVPTHEQLRDEAEQLVATMTITPGPITSCSLGRE